MLWSSETSGITGEGFYTNAELAEMTAEFGNSGSVFYEPPAGFDKVYYYDEGSFGLKFYLEAPSGAGQLSCYGYNSVYSTLSSGGVMSWEADLSSFTERRHTAPDGTELIHPLERLRRLYLRLSGGLLLRHARATARGA